MRGMTARRTTSGFIENESARSASYSESLGKIEDVLNSAHRDHHPIRPVIQFVANFVDRLVEQISFEQGREIAPRLRHETGVDRRLEIALEKSRAHLSIPEIGPALEERHVLAPHRGLPERA